MILLFLLLDAREHLTHVLANAGGVIVSYIGWVQGKQGYWWRKEEVLSKLEVLMQVTFSDVWIRSQEEQINLKSLAFHYSILPYISNNKSSSCIVK